LTTPNAPLSVDDHLVFFDEMLQDLFVKWKWLSAYLDTLLQNDNPDIKTLVRAFRIYIQIFGCFGRILRDRKALASPISNGLQEMINQALDELSAELRMKL
jgi:hypothetical protein